MLFQEIEQKTRQMDPTFRGAYTLLKEAFSKKLNTIISDSDNSCEKGDARKCDGAREEWQVPLSWAGQASPF